MVSSSLGTLQLNSSFSLFLSPNQRIYSHGSMRFHRIWKPSMCLSAKPTLGDGNLKINGNEVLTKVPDNVLVTPWTNGSAFVGATSKETSSRHVFTLGVLQQRLNITFTSRFNLHLTGDPAIVTSQSHKAVFVNYGDNPFELMKESMK
ncbi:hypothetical protein MKX01_021339 [Papaver californicum]|nr:hypothetical protein MKX01_021339 [Papaver californicum]